MLTMLPRKKFTVPEYHRMGEFGILNEWERLELIEGDIFCMTPIGKFHASRVDKLNHLFVSKFGDDAIVRVQNPVQLDDSSEPEPDIALLLPRKDFYAARHPTPKDIFLIVEIADTTIRYDRKVKLPLYGKSGIREFWLVDLKAQCVEVYTKPSEHGYDMLKKFRKGAITVAQAFPDTEIEIDDILG